MNKKITALLILVVAILIAGYAWLSHVRSFGNAYIDIRRTDIAVTIYDTKDNEVQKLSSSGEISLKKGEYSVVPSGDNIATDPIALRVTDTHTRLKVDPGYSENYLDTLLSQENSSVQAVLTATYPAIIQSFTINPGSLYRYGDWYATTLTQQSPAPGQWGDTYRTVLHKQNDKWTVAATPAIVLSAKDHPSIPKSILDAANEQRGY